MDYIPGYQRNKEEVISKSFTVILEKSLSGPKKIGGEQLSFTSSKRRRIYENRAMNLRSVLDKIFKQIIKRYICEPLYKHATISRI